LGDGSAQELLETGKRLGRKKMEDHDYSDQPDDGKNRSRSMYSLIQSPEQVEAAARHARRTTADAGNATHIIVTGPAGRQSAATRAIASGI
jgi:hypothetical protein